MSYRQEREQFIIQAAREGIDQHTIGKLLRYSTTLQRLAVAQCNGDWPYNGDRDRPWRDNSTEHTPISSQAFGIVRAKHDARYTVCPKCEASGVAKSAMRYAHMPVPGYAPDEQRARGQEGVVPKICPDCRTVELVNIALAGIGTVLTQTSDSISVTDTHDTRITAVFAGDPRGAVLRLVTPGYPWSEDGREGNGLYVPAR